MLFDVNPATKSRVLAKIFKKYHKNIRKLIKFLYNLGKPVSFNDLKVEPKRLCSTGLPAVPATILCLKDHSKKEDHPKNGNNPKERDDLKTVGTCSCW